MIHGKRLDDWSWQIIGYIVWALALPVILLAMLFEKIVLALFGDKE